MLPETDQERLIKVLTRIYVIEGEYYKKGGMSPDPLLLHLRTIPETLFRNEIYDRLRIEGTLSPEQYEKLIKKSQSQQAAGYSISWDFLILTGNLSIIASTK